MKWSRSPVGRLSQICFQLQARGERPEIPPVVHEFCLVLRELREVFCLLKNRFEPAAGTHVHAFLEQERDRTSSVHISTVALNEMCTSCSLKETKNLAWRENVLLDLWTSDKPSQKRSCAQYSAGTPMYLSKVFCSVV